MKQIAIIGAGLAGTALAWTLKSRGFVPVIYEAGARIATAASGNNIGLYNPRFAAEKNAESLYYITAFELALATFWRFDDVDWNPCGALHLLTDEKRVTRFSKAVQNWGWPPARMRIIDKNESSRIAGIELNYEALYLPESGTISPEKLCAAYAKDVDVKYNVPLQNMQDMNADIIVLANGAGVTGFTETSHLPLKTVRGQLTYAKAGVVSKQLKSNLCYGGYISPAIEGQHAVGATFQRWLDHDEIIDEDDAYNIAQLAEIAPALAKNLEISGHRASRRMTSPDHLPVVGRLKDNLYISAAHGSHGILSSLLAAHIIADQIEGKETLVPEETLKKISPARF